MLDGLPLEPADPLLALIGLFRADPRPDKIDLGVGVYRDEAGETPVMSAVKAAERQLFETQDTKAYVGPSGDLEFIQRLRGLVLGESVGADRLAAAQTPGGTGALRLGADLLARAGAGPVLVGRPTWGNHDPILAAAGLAILDYRAFDTATQTVVFDDMLAAFEAAPAGAVALLQASCHNPTGGDLTGEQWAQIAEVIGRRGLLPFIDVAYQGFGLGLDEDMAGARHVIAQVPESLVAVSCSKTFGLYRERTGALFAVCGAAKDTAAVLSNMLADARANYSMPPDHGAAVVRTILESDDLRRLWTDELAQARGRIQAMRRLLADQALAAGLDLGAQAQQLGMFSQLALSPDQVRALRETHALYVTGSGRINVAGLHPDQVPAVIARLLAVIEPAKSGV